MYVLLASMGLFVLLGLVSDRFGAVQRVATLTLAAGMAAVYLFVRSTY